MQYVAYCDNSHKWEYTDILIELAEDQASVKPMVVGYYDALQGILQRLWGGGSPEMVDLRCKDCWSQSQWQEYDQ